MLTLDYRKQQLEFQCGWITVGVVFNAVGALFMDKVGRKPLMLFGVAGCGVCLIIEAAIVATYAEAATNKTALAAGVGKSKSPFFHAGKPQITWKRANIMCF